MGAASPAMLNVAFVSALLRLPGFNVAAICIELNRVISGTLAKNVFQNCSA
jgi:hypothetical protein